jgi:hypothetical protein
MGQVLRFMVDVGKDLISGRESCRGAGLRSER